jgi:uncharacterized OsmC-like protein
MGLISQELKGVFEKLRSKLQETKGSMESMATNRAEVRLVENQYNEATVRGFTVRQDEPESVKGGNRGPTPTDYFTASIGFCENVILARNAALNDLSIDSLETTITGEWERKGLFEIDGKEPSFRTITVETRIQTKDSPDKAAEVVRLTHRTCPVHATLKKATSLTFKLFVNGDPVGL